MTKITPIIPRKSAPSLIVQTTQGKTWELKTSSAKNFTMIIIYRGLHCPICANYLKKFDQNLEKFSELGVKTIAISTDNYERAKQSHKNWGLKELLIGYDLSVDMARAWGLYISSGIINPSAAVTEPEKFVEPGLFLIKSDNTVYMSQTQSMPFTRPSVDEILGGIKFAIENKYPARGELVC
tara:strand:- start:796 stop:1341 length:546 start_codon:yes stop_codon:yes gene_type:complete